MSSSIKGNATIIITLTVNNNLLIIRILWEVEMMTIGTHTVTRNIIRATEGVLIVMMLKTMHEHLYT